MSTAEHASPIEGFLPYSSRPISDRSVLKKNKEAAVITSILGFIPQRKK